MHWCQSFSLQHCVFILGKGIWAKDLVFLFTSEDEWGPQAWVEAYFGIHNPSISLNYRNFSIYSASVVVAEWLRRWTRNPLGSARAGSNPADYAFLSFFFPTFLLVQSSCMNLCSVDQAQSKRL